MAGRLEGEGEDQEEKPWLGELDEARKNREANLFYKMVEKKLLYEGHVFLLLRGRD